MTSSSEALKVYRSYKVKAERQGWRVEDLSKGWKFSPPDRSLPFVTLHKTPSDWRWFQNFRTAMRRSGFREE
jgi:hypothetical protein